jgi:hypothetical protein
MTVNEMHIAVNLGVQKIASFQADILLPQEIDFELNIAMMRFIKQRYNPSSNRLGKGFEQSQKRVDDLRNLLVTTKSDTIVAGGFLSDAIGQYIYTTSETNIYIERATLPLDYLFLVSVTAAVHYNCKTTIADQLVETKVTTEWVKASLTPPIPGFYLTGIEYYNGSNWTSIINNSLGSELTRDEMFDTNNYLNNFLPSINANIVENANNTGAQLDPPVDSNHIYFLNRNISFGNDGSGNYLRTIWTINGSMFYANYQYEQNRTVSPPIVSRSAPTADQRISQCWFVQSDDIPKSMRDPFNKTSFDYIPYSVKENFIDIYSDNSFVVPQVYIVYIRKPKTISITNNIGCELPEHTHQEIVEMTIKSILEGIESQRYNSQSMETFESE